MPVNAPCMNPVHILIGGSCSALFKAPFGWGILGLWVVYPPLNDNAHRPQSLRLVSQSEPKSWLAAQ